MSLSPPLIDTKKLFSITQAAKACGLSRSTLLRMEERGLLTPAYISPDSGRRYYDNHNVSRILQIQRFQAMGFGAEETAKYFAAGGEAAELLDVLEKKLALLQQSVEEMRLRSMQFPNMSVRIMTIPETTCCVRHCSGKSVQDRYDEMYDFYHECIERGFVLSREPLFVINESMAYLEGARTDELIPFQVCVPVVPKKGGGDTVYFPACTVLSVLYYGDYTDIYDAWRRLGTELHERGLTPAGYPRGIAIVAPYTGREIDPAHYCSRLVIPIEDQ